MMIVMTNNKKNSTIVVLFFLLLLLVPKLLPPTLVYDLYAPEIVDNYECPFGRTSCDIVDENCQ